MDWRWRRLGSQTMRRRRGLPSIAPIITRTAEWTMPSMSQSTLVSGGVSSADIGWLSKPVTETSSGTARPSSRVAA